MTFEEGRSSKTAGSVVWRLEIKLWHIAESTIKGEKGEMEF